MTATTPRALRADAERNLRRVLDAALEVFAEHGFDAPVTLIAERADVGVATIFRRFPTKDDLLAALLAHRGEQMVAAADRALEQDDAGEAFRELAEFITAAQISDRGFCDAIGTDLFAREDIQTLFDGVRKRLVSLIARAQASGALRPEVTAEDVLFVLYGVARTGLMVERSAPGLWRRYLAVALDGLKPGGVPLPGRPPTRRQFDAARCGS
jgi:AcrR family transcriptional regulator